MILVTGGAGFIGSNLVRYLNRQDQDDILIVDELDCSKKWLNLRSLRYSRYMHKDQFFSFQKAQDIPFKAIFHLGACSDTEETNMQYLMENNVDYSIRLCELAQAQNIPFIYASSAATYGAIDQSFYDDEDQIHTLRPLNPYGYSKQLFDCWLLKQEQLPKVTVGLKFFNVYGSNEEHKGKMASLVSKYNKAAQAGESVNLFCSDHPDYKDGEQLRDFVYVKDVVKVLYHFYQQHLDGLKVPKAIYNLGTGKPETFKSLVTHLFSAYGQSPKINWIPTPASLKDQYQYRTCAEMQKLRELGLYTEPFMSLEEGILDFTQDEKDNL